MHMHVIGNGAAVLGQDDETFFQYPFLQVCDLDHKEVVPPSRRIASLPKFVTSCCERLVPHAIPLDQVVRLRSTDTHPEAETQIQVKYHIK